MPQLSVARLRHKRAPCVTTRIAFGYSVLKDPKAATSGQDAPCGGQFLIIEKEHDAVKQKVSFLKS